MANCTCASLPSYWNTEALRPKLTVNWLTRAAVGKKSHTMALILFDALSEMWATHVFNIANGKLPSRSVGVHFSFLYEKKKRKMRHGGKRVPRKSNCAAFLVCRAYTLFHSICRLEYKSTDCEESLFLFLSLHVRSTGSRIRVCAWFHRL